MRTNECMYSKVRYDILCSKYAWARTSSRYLKAHFSRIFSLVFTKSRLFECVHTPNCHIGYSDFFHDVRAVPLW